MSAVLKLLIRIERAFIVFFCLALAFLMVVQIILRYVFIAPFLGVEEIAVLLGLWIYFLGLIHVTRTRQHISSGVLQLFVRGPASMRAMEIFKLVVCVASSAIFLVFSVQYWIKTADSGRISTYLSWPMTNPPPDLWRNIHNVHHNGCLACSADTSLHPPVFQWHSSVFVSCDATQATVLQRLSPDPALLGRICVLCLCCTPIPAFPPLIPPPAPAKWLGLIAFLRSPGPVLRLEAFFALTPDAARCQPTTTLRSGTRRIQSATTSRSRA